MLDIRPVLFVIGALLLILAVFMVLPAIADMMVHNNDWKSFAFSAFLTAFVGGCLILTNRGHVENINIRQAFILTAFAWVVVAAFAALPIHFATLDISYTDAYFEVMSGLTTTGSTVLVGLDFMPPGILLWRALLQGMGGIGIIVVALAVLPMLRIGGMQLFKTESSDTADKILPRTTQIATAILGTYLFLIFACTVLLWAAGMGEFDAFCHAMAAVSTGGFSTHDASIIYYNNALIEFIIIVFMISGALPFTTYIQMINSNHKAFFEDTQIRWFFGIISGIIVTLTLWLHFNANMGLLEALRKVSFNVVSVITTTGFASTDYALWGSFPVTVFFMITVIGGCTGSTAGGIKIFRYQILLEAAKSQLNHLIHPHAIFRPRFNGKPVPESIGNSVMSYIILFAFCFLIIATLVSLTGADFITSMSAAATTLANVGPGLGDVIGPVGNFSTLTDSAKWLLSFSMLLGRLELFTILVLFSPYFWRD